MVIEYYSRGINHVEFPALPNNLDLPWYANILPLLDHTYQNLVQSQTPVDKHPYALVRHRNHRPPPTYNDLVSRLEHTYMNLPASNGTYMNAVSLVPVFPSKASSAVEHTLNDIYMHQLYESIRSSHLGPCFMVPFEFNVPFNQLISPVCLSPPPAPLRSSHTSTLQVSLVTLTRKAQ